MGHLLEVKDLEVTFALRFGDLTAIDGISFTLDKKEKLGLVGESGAGKSVTGFSIINLADDEMRKIRGDKISMIFQDPMMTLNPVLTICTQMTETVHAHRNVTKSEAIQIALDKLKKVYIPSPEKRLFQYPHECSGGMRQRIVVAIALLTNPALIIADEPTTALDVTIQAGITDLLSELCETEDMGLILITHDLAVVSQVTEKIAVMYAGKIIETGRTEDIIKNPRHPYTKGLIGSLPGGQQMGKRLTQIKGMMPTLTDIPQGCAFHPRCGISEQICRETTPLLESVDGEKRLVACHMAGV